MHAEALGQLTTRKVAISNSEPSATGVTYTFSFTTVSATTVKSVAIDLCSTLTGCTPPSTNTPTGESTTSATLGSASIPGSGGSWTGTFTTNNLIEISNSSNASGSAGAATITINGITNSSTANGTIYAEITTYSDAAWTTALDTGNVATSTMNSATGIQVSGTVAETLTFCTGTSGITSSSCSGATGSTVSLGTLSSSTTGSGTSQFGATTNAGSGYTVTVNGTTLTSGSNTIAALATQTASTQGTGQFGMNLMANTTPSVGTAVSGAGSAAPSANYGTANQYRFVTGDTIASASAPDNFRLFTVSYIANISGTTPPGTYSTNLTYICTPQY
jgi:hypothetical protein